MTTRVTAAAFLAVSALVAWVTITVPLAARLLQLSILLSMLYVAYLAWRGARVMRQALAWGRSGAAEPTGLAGDLPFVSLVVAARNEATVIGRAVAALAGQAYAREGGPHYEVLVVDDASTDATHQVARTAAAEAPHVTVLRREPEPGPRTKGSVLAFALPFLRGEVIGVIDADSDVAPSFLERAMRAWSVRDATAVAFQVARLPRNAEVSWLTAAQAEEQLMDMASQCGRWATDGTAELRGNGMFVRRPALEAVGGWRLTAMTEDLELSTRLSAAGHHVALAPDVAVREEAVERLSALWPQRLRWAEGSMRRLLDHGPALLTGSQPIGRKADFLAFAAEFFLPPLFAAAIVASLVTIPLPRPADWTVPASLFAGYGLGVFLLAIGGLSATGVRGLPLLGRALRGALFLSHWLVVVPWALLRITFLPASSNFVQTPRFTGSAR
ncbi:MAG: glycosyltransferase family 2 protein [Chloroflexota bacterium]|nr:glycosyltransferase family 2 protein [Chloroflexota bacterium]